jgi:hypothetical protein
MKVVNEIKVDILMLNTYFFPKNLAASEIITKKKCGRSDKQ